MGAFLFSRQRCFVEAVGYVGGDVVEDAGAEDPQFGGFEFAGPAQQHCGGLVGGVRVDFGG